MIREPPSPIKGVPGDGTVNADCHDGYDLL